MIIQGAINRMAGNSFLIKGWSVTLVVGLSAFAAKDSDASFAAIAIGAAVLFGGLDAYYLALEKKFRTLYDNNIPADPSKPGNANWIMSPGRVTPKEFFAAVLRPVVWILHGGLLVAAGAVIYYAT